MAAPTLRGNRLVGTGQAGLVALLQRVPDELGVVTALLVIIGFVGACRPDFVSPSNLLHAINTGELPMPAA